MTEVEKLQKECEGLQKQLEGLRRSIPLALHTVALRQRKETVSCIHGKLLNVVGTHWLESILEAGMATPLVTEVDELEALALEQGHSNEIDLDGEE